MNNEPSPLDYTVTMDGTYYISHEGDKVAILDSKNDLIMMVGNIWNGEAMPPTIVEMILNAYTLGQHIGQKIGRDEMKNVVRQALRI